MNPKKVTPLKNSKIKRKRKNKLLLLIAILAIIGIMGSLVWKRNEISKHILENYISRVVNADISLSSININGDGIYFQDLRVESQSELYYYLDTPKLNIDIDYTALLNRKDWLNEVVDSLYVEAPILSYKQHFIEEKASPKKRIRPKNEIQDSKKEKTPFDIRHYLRKANIVGAKVNADVIYQEYFGIRDNFSQANITFDNNRENNLSVDMLDNQLNPFLVSLSFDNIGLQSITLDVNGYNPDSLFVPVAKNLEVDLHGNAKLYFPRENDLHLTLALNSKTAKTTLFDMPLEVNNLNISGDSKSLQISPEETLFLGIPVLVRGSLINLFNKLEIEANAEVKEYQIGQTYNFMEGEVSGDIAVSGFAKDLYIYGNVVADSLDFNTLAITNFQATIAYQEQLEIFLNNAELDQNVLSGRGILHKNFISADLQIKNKEDSNITLQGDLLTKGIVLDGDSYFRLGVSDFTIGYNQLLLPPISGLVSLDKDRLKGTLANNNLLLNIDTDLSFEKSYASLEFIDYQANTSYTVLNEDIFSTINPLLNGMVVVNKNMDDIEADLDLEITAFSDKIYLPLKTNINWDIATNKMNISNQIINGKIFDNKTNMIADLSLNDFDELNLDLEINDDIIIQSKNLLSKERSFKLNVNQLSLSELRSYLPEELTKNYPKGFITFNFDYLWSDQLVKGDVIITGIEVAGFSGYGVEGIFEGSPDRICLNEFIIYNERQVLVNASGSLETTNGILANIDAVVNEINFTDYQSFIPLKGYLSAGVNFRYDSQEKEKYTIRFKGVGSDFNIADYDINDVYFNVLYSPQKFHVDNLYLSSLNYADMNIIGDFSYDLFKNEFIPSQERLYVKIDANAYRLLNKMIPKVFEDGNFDLSSELIIGIDEEGLVVYDGYINTQDSFLKVVDQPEIFDNIDITAEIENNKLDIKRFKLRAGDGYLTVANHISQDNDNFFIGSLVLGQFKIDTSQRGLLVHIPQYMAKTETALVKLSGTSNSYATVKGPFDDMKIDVEVNVSNASIIYPPGTENLLSIITSASKNTFSKKEKTPKKEETSANPLPFELDARLIVGENLKYVTYPTDISVNPNSYLKLKYDNSEWTVPDARFIAEDGTVTFLDTDFDVELVQVVINELDLSINGTFYKRVADGSTVTLKVSNEQSNQLGIDDLVLTLASDNPDDKTQAQAINRLRVTDSSYDIEQEDQNTLQNETILMLGSNVDNSFINNLFRPVETFFRRRLKLDYFNIRPGFVKNMVSSYVINDRTDQIQTGQTQEISDSELAQFSSSILLNNLTINLGRPVYKRLFFNYTGFFQETTDIGNRTKIIYDQDLQLRTNINYRTKMSYTYKLRPNSDNSHEIMLFHNINF